MNENIPCHVDVNMLWVITHTTSLKLLTMYFYNFALLDFIWDVYYPIYGKIDEIYHYLLSIMNNIMNICRDKMTIFKHCSKIFSDL